MVEAAREKRKVQETKATLVSPLYTTRHVGHKGSTCGKPQFKKSLLPDGNIYGPPPRRLSTSYLFCPERCATGARTKREVRELGERRKEPQGITKDKKRIMMQQ